MVADIDSLYISRPRGCYTIPRTAVFPSLGPPAVETALYLLRDTCMGPRSCTTQVIVFALVDKFGALQA